VPGHEPRVQQRHHAALRREGRQARLAADRGLLQQAPQGVVVVKRHVLALVAALAVASASLNADVTVISTMKMEGKAPGMAQQQLPKMVTHVKGNMAATIMELGGNTMTSIVDLKGRR